MNNHMLAGQATEKTLLGFWVYLMSDCALFASLFAVYAVLRHSTAGGEGAVELFQPPFVLAETILLLTSSFTCGLSLWYARQSQLQTARRLLAVTLALGAAFLGMELYEFHALYTEGNGWQRSAFLSAFFTLVGTHGLHIAIGTIWGGVLLWRLRVVGLNEHLLRKFTLFSMFWHFLDVVWIFIFSVVYLLGVMNI